MVGGLSPCGGRAGVRWKEGRVEVRVERRSSMGAEKDGEMDG